MEFLQKRRFWYALGILAALSVTFAAYIIPPQPTLLGLMFDLLGFAATFFGGLLIISQFVLPVQTMAERERAYEHFFNYFFGAHGPIIFVRDGKIIARKEELRRAGQGVALLDSCSAIVLERTAVFQWWGRPDVEQPLVRAAGPGVVFIQPGERIVATLDLRKQTRKMVAKALTKDGIEVSAPVSVTFGLDPQSGYPIADTAVTPEQTGSAERNKPAYPFNAAAAFGAVYGMALGEKQSIEWTDLPVNVAVERFRDSLAECNLDDLFKPTVSNVYPFGEFQAKVNAMVKEAPVLRERGIVVYSVGVGAPKLPREVINQRVRSWQARWQKAAIQTTAAGDTQSIKTTSRWKTRAQEVIIKDWRDRLAAATDPLEKKALALVLTRALQRTAADPATRQLLSLETIKLLDSIPEWLK